MQLEKQEEEEGEEVEKAKIFKIVPCNA